MSPGLLDFDFYICELDREVALTEPIDYGPDDRPNSLGSREQRGLALLGPPDCDCATDLPAQEQVEKLLDCSNEFIRFCEQRSTVEANKRIIPLGRRR
jgi:hypothetical protein